MKYGLIPILHLLTQDHLLPLRKRPRRRLFTHNVPVRLLSLAVASSELHGIQL